jgi:hypothetical protein
VALAISVAVNLALVVNRSPERRVDPEASVKEGAGREPGIGTPVFKEKRPAVVATRPSSVPGMPSTECAEAQKRLAELLPLVPATKRFASEPADPSHEAPLRAELERLLADVEHTLECRGLQCRVSIIAPEGSDDALWGRLQGDAGLGAQSCSFGFTPSKPTNDVITGAPLEISDVYIGLCSGPRMRPILAKLVADVRASGVVETCAQRSADRGRLSLVIAGSRAGLQLWTGGPLGATPVGRCITEGLDQALANVRLPDDVLPGELQHDRAARGKRSGGKSAQLLGKFLTNGIPRRSQR